jgi:hypothetical protein
MFGLGKSDYNYLMMSYFETLKCGLAQVTDSALQSKIAFTMSQYCLRYNSPLRDTVRLKYAITQQECW